MEEEDEVKSGSTDSTEDPLQESLEGGLGGLIKSQTVMLNVRPGEGGEDNSTFQITLQEDEPEEEGEDKDENTGV